MTGSDRVTMRIAGRVAALAVVMGTACSEYPRTNPFDPQATVALTLAGPDSATSIGDTVAFEVRSAQGEPLGTLARWEVPAFLTHVDGRGRFVVNASLKVVRTTGTVTATINQNVVSKPFVLSQKPVRITARDCSGRPVVTFTALASSSFGAGLGAQPLCVALIDNRGNVVPDVAGLSATIRDTRVVQFVSSNLLLVNAYAVGSTYIVYSRGDLVDSILVNVRQDPVSFGMFPTACSSSFGLKMSVGESVQLSPTTPILDANGNVVTNTAAVQSVLVSLGWATDFSRGLSVTSSGLVTALATGNGSVYAGVPQGTTLRPVAYCRISVF